MNDELIHAAMNGDLKGLTEAIAHEADPNASRDMYGLTALHYVSHKGNLEMTQALLKAGANPVAQDNGGLMPICRAILTGSNDVVEALLAAMESQASPSFYKPLVGDLSAAALEPDQYGTSIANDLVRRIISWEAQNLTEGISLVHLWANADLSIFVTIFDCSYLKILIVFQFHIFYFQLGSWVLESFSFRLRSPSGRKDVLRIE